MRKSLEDLIFLGRIEKDVNLFDKTWKMVTLDSTEHLAATNATADFDTLTRFFALKVQIISRSLKQVNDIVLDDLEETYKFVEKLQPIVINKLYEEYEKIQLKQSESLKDMDEIKN